MAATRFSVLTSGMAEHRFLRNPQSAAAPPQNRTGIPINWKEGAVITIKIRHHPAETAMKVCSIHLKPGWPPGHDARLALDAEAKTRSASRPERRAA